MNDIPKHDWTKNTDEFFAWKDNGIMDRIQDFIETLDWEQGDDIVVELGGTQVSGIEQPEEYNKKWASPLGHRKYNKDCFIVLKNKSRDPFESSKPMDREYTPHHLKTEKELTNEKKESDGRTS